MSNDGSDTAASSAPEARHSGLPNCAGRFCGLLRGHRHDIAVLPDRSSPTSKLLGTHNPDHARYGPTNGELIRMMPKVGDKVA
jgi:hypothetical protein